MSGQKQSHEGRELYPDQTPFDESAPDGWRVREVKNYRHVIFEYEGGEQGSPIVHAESDGISPLVSLHDGRAVPFSGEPEGSSFEAALRMAEAVMATYAATVDDE